MIKWIQAARLFAIGASVMPAAYGALLARHDTGSFHPLLFVLTLIGIACIHTGANLINDYFDHLTGADEKNLERQYPFSGGSRVIQNKEIPAGGILIASLCCFAVGAGIGIYLAGVAGPGVLWLGLFGILTSIFYVSPVCSLTSLGIGELVIGLDFGILNVAGAWYVQTGSFSWVPVFAAIPLSLSIALILIVNEFPDFQGDRDAGKKTLIVRVGKKRGAKLLALLLALTAVSIVLNALFGITGLLSLSALLAAPFLFHAAKTALRHFDHPGNMLPANIAVINSQIFINGFLIISCLLSGSTRPLGLILGLLFCAFMVLTLFKTGIVGRSAKTT